MSRRSSRPQGSPPGSPGPWAPSREGAQKQKHRLCVGLRIPRKCVFGTSPSQQRCSRGSRMAWLCRAPLAPGATLGTCRPPLLASRHLRGCAPFLVFPRGAVCCPCSVRPTARLLRVPRGSWTQYAGGGSTWGALLCTRPHMSRFKSKVKTAP